MGMMDEAWKESVRDTNLDPIKIKMSSKRYVICSDCNGNGYKKNGSFTETCQTCDGDGNLDLVNVLDMDL